MRVIREYVEALRLLLAGGAVTMDGEVQKLCGAHMEFGKNANVPIYIASTGPQVLNLAGQIGDGVLLSAGMTLANCRRCLDIVDAGAKSEGRDVNTVKKAGFINFQVSRDGDTAKSALLRKLAFLFRSKGHAANIESSGLSIDHAAIIAALGQRDLNKATGLLPREAADVFGVSGTPTECSDRLEAYLSIGLTEPIIEICGTPEERSLALDVVREVAGR